MLRPPTGEPFSWRRQAAEIFDEAMFGAGQLVYESAPFLYAPPECIIAAQAVGSEALISLRLSRSALATSFWLSAF